MPKTLILIRHAKSAWNNPGLDDFDRPLNARGRASASAIGEWLFQNDRIPQKILTSGARRTVETWERMSGVFPNIPQAENLPSLYLAAASTIFSILRKQDADSVMVICHNPGIADFAARVVSKPPNDNRFHRYPTAATTVINFDLLDWDDLAWSSGTVVDFAVPRDLLS